MIRVLSFLLALLLGCRHESRYRERRTVKGIANVLMLICDRCGHAVPAMARSAKEQRRVSREGAIKMATAQKQEPQKIRRIG